MKKTKTFVAVESVLHQNRISQVSKVSPRDSDTELIIQFLQFHTDIQLKPYQVEVLRQVKFESITRARHKLQEKGEYLPSPEVAKKRRLKSYEVEQVAPKESAAGLQRRIEENA